jgi:hypothetical protein
MKHVANEGLPTPERLKMAEGYLEIGDDKQGTRVYHFLDTCLDRTYADLIRKATGEIERNLASEYEALTKLNVAYVSGHLNGNVGSIDFDRTYCPSTEGRSFLAATEKVLHYRDVFRAGMAALSVHQVSVVGDVVMGGRSLENAGYVIGCKSQRRAIERARNVLRSAGEVLANLWNIG